MATRQTTIRILPDNPRKPRRRAQSFDRLLGLRIRERRIQLGMNQQQLAERIGVTYQQAHKYEKGINRIAAGRLDTIAKALGCSLADLLAGIGEAAPELDVTERQRMDAAQLFARLDRTHAAAVLKLMRALVGQECD
jgi:transcriptional regulator with XRE-family HTH domain